MAFRPFGKIRIFDDRGYAYIPKILQNELGIKGKCAIPFYIGASAILLIRKGASRNDILRSLNILREDFALRSKEASSDQNEAAVLECEAPEDRPHGGDGTV